MMHHLAGMRVHRWTFQVAWLLTTAMAAEAGERRVLVLCNGRETESVELARHYATTRRVTEDRILRLDCPTEEGIARAEFGRTVRQPVAAWLRERGWLAENHRPVVIVMMRGIPLRIEGTLGDFGQRTTDQHRNNDAASIDSELAALALPDSPDTKGSMPNPAFGSNTPPPGVIVGRLDGPDWATPKRLVDDAVAVEKAGRPGGRAIIDHAEMAGRGDEYARGELWLSALEARFNAERFTVTADREPSLIANAPGEGRTVFFYAGWYAPHVGGLLAKEEFRFAPGAVACHIHSLSAQTVRATGQRWAGPLLAHGAAVVLGNVDEPFLSHSTHLDIFFDLLLRGNTAGEAMWKATPRLSWMNVMVGDPLYRPFGGKH